MLDYIKEQQKAPVKMQNWNPLEYAQKREQIMQDNLKRKSMGKAAIAGAQHYGAGKSYKDARGVTRYDRAAGTGAEALAKGGVFDAIKAQYEREVNPDILNMDSRYVTEGIKPGEAPDWAVGLNRPVKTPEQIAKETADAANAARRQAVSDRRADRQIGGAFNEYDANMRGFRG